MTLSDNPIGASYLYLLEPEIRFWRPLSSI